MGRRQHLARLVLGRSAFEKGEDAEEATPGASFVEHHGEDNSHYEQQYDSKGRPINPAVEDFNSNLRDAKNAVLELVGVVERKDQTDHADKLDQIRLRYRRSKRDALLRQEDEYGELLDYTFVPITYFCKLWPDAFLERVQIGYYDSSMSMAKIVASEWECLFSRDGWFSLAKLFPGLAAKFAHFAIKISLILVVEHLAGRLQDWILSRNFSRKTTARIHDTIPKLAECLLYAVDIVLLPLEFHATALRLGLAPPPLHLPSVQSFWPRSSRSFHNYGWRPIVRTTFPPGLARPAWLMMCDKVINYDTDDESRPVMSLFTSFRYPQINEHNKSSTFLSRHPQSKSYNAIGWLLEKQYLLRQRFLTWCNWTNTLRNPNPCPHHISGHDANAILPATVLPDSLNEQNLPIQRSTYLAHLPAKYLAKLLDTFFTRLFLLPFESLLLRTISRTYLATPSTVKTSVGLAAFPSLHAPFGGSPLSILIQHPTSPSAWSALATYTSRLSLALALNAAIDTLLFFTVSATTRHIGIKYFEWQRKSHIGLAGQHSDGKTREIDSAETNSHERE